MDNTYKPTNEAIPDLESKIKLLENKIKELENIPKHGDKIKLYELVKNKRNIEVPLAQIESLNKIKNMAVSAQNKQINDNKFNDKRINTKVQNTDINLD